MEDEHSRSVLDALKKVLRRPAHPYRADRTPSDTPLPANDIAYEDTGMSPERIP
jgi:hypothetical protein